MHLYETIAAILTFPIAVVIGIFHAMRENESERGSDPMRCGTEGSLPRWDPSTSRNSPPGGRVPQAKWSDRR